MEPQALQTPNFIILCSSANKRHSNFPFLLSLALGQTMNNLCLVGDVYQSVIIPEEWFQNFG